MIILLADDEKPLVKFLNRGLSAEGYTCFTVNQLSEVIPSVKKHQPDIMVLDRLFENEDSLTIVEAIKMLPTPPLILMLTALDEVRERVKGLEKGADDYLCKPFDFDELLARITALKRLLGKRSESVSQVLNVGGLNLYLEEGIAKLNQVELELTKIEYDLLLYLTRNVNTVLSRDKILNSVWQTYDDPLTNIVDVYISRLRRKLEDDPKIAIQTVRGAGYRLRELSEKD